MALSMTPNGYLPTRHPKCLITERADLAVVRALLRHSFSNRGYDFDVLTERERNIIGTPGQLARIKQFATEDE